MKKTNYDCVIIGSGIGGMCAAALLAHAGYKTLVVEKMPRLGGRCSTIEYKGYKLTTGVLTLAAYGGPLDSIWNEVGAEYDVRTTSPSGMASLYYRIAGEDYPAPQTGFKDVIALASKNSRDVDMVWDAIQRAMTWQEPLGNISLRDWLLQFTHDRSILSILNTISINHLVVPLWVLPAVEFIRYLDKPLLMRARGYAPNGSSSIIDSLARAIRENGGDVWASCPARKIIVSNHLVKGIIIEKGGENTEIGSQVVISDIGPKNTVMLADKQNFDISYLKELEQTIWPVPGIYVNFSTPVDNPVAKYPRLYLTNTQRVFNIRTPTYSCPELAPPGRHLVTAIGCPVSMSPPFYFKRELRLFMQELSENLEGFDEYADVLMVGSYYGEYPIFRTVVGYDMPLKTSVENLYNVGDAVKPPGWTGSEACGASARMVVDDIKKRIKPKA